MKTVSISRNAAQAIGLDDPCLMSDIRREWKNRQVVCTGSDSALRYLSDVLSDYSGIDGDDIASGLTSAQRTACKLAYNRIRGKRS